MYPPSSASMGVLAMDSATVVSSSLQSERSMSPLLSAIPRATKANSPAERDSTEAREVSGNQCKKRKSVCCGKLCDSPPWASSRPLSWEFANDMPNARDNAVMIEALPTISAASIAEILGASFTIIANWGK